MVSLIYMQASCCFSRVFNRSPSTYALVWLALRPLVHNVFACMEHPLSRHLSLSVSFLRARNNCDKYVCLIVDYCDGWYTLSITFYFNSNFILSTSSLFIMEM